MGSLNIFASCPYSDSFIRCECLFMHGQNAYFLNDFSCLAWLSSSAIGNPMSDIVIVHSYVSSINVHSAYKGPLAWMAMWQCTSMDDPQIPPLLLCISVLWTSMYHSWMSTVPGTMGNGCWPLATYLVWNYRIKVMSSLWCTGSVV